MSSLPSVLLEFGFIMSKSFQGHVKKDKLANPVFFIHIKYSLYNFDLIKILQQN